MALAGLLLLPWMMHRMVEYATEIFNNIPLQL
jgi:flagellar biosynthesis protein FliQ